MKISFSFDDATVEDIKIAELIKEYGLVENTVFFWPVMPTVSNSQKGRESLTQKQQMEIAKDFEIGSHTITHRLLTRIPLEEARTEIVESKKLLQAAFNQPIRQFSYPRGYANPEIQKIVQDAGYERARSTLVGYLHESENPFFEQTTVHAGYDRKEYGGKNWFEYAMHMLNLAKNTPNSVYSVFGHGYELAAYPNGFKLFEELIKELKSV